MTHVYNAFNQLTRIKSNNSNGKFIAEFIYNADGNRIKKIETINNANTTTYYIGDNFIRIINSSGTYDETYYYHDNALIAANKSGTMLYYHADHLGSTNLVTNQSGHVIENTSFNPFGDLVEDGFSRNLFTGKIRDKSANIDYFQNRYFCIDLIRFCEPDSVIQDTYNPADLNHYAYVRNNPYKYVDPDGRAVVYAGFSGTAGAVVGVSKSTGVVASYDQDYGFQLGTYQTDAKGLLVPASLGVSAEAGLAPGQKQVSEFSGKGFELGLSISKIPFVAGGATYSLPESGDVSKFSAEGNIGVDASPFKVSASFFESDTTVNKLYQSRATPTNQRSGGQAKTTTTNPNRLELGSRNGKGYSGIIYNKRGNVNDFKLIFKGRVYYQKQTISKNEVKRT